MTQTLHQVSVATPRPAWPGVLTAVLGGASVTWFAWHLAGVSAIVLAVVLGAVIGNFGRLAQVLQPGLTSVSKRPLRVGVVLLGLRLGVEDVISLGWQTLALVCLTVAATFFGTQALGRRMGLSPALSLLVATGYSICGASAIAAMESTSGAEQEEVAVSIGLVTLAGTAAMFGLPFLAGQIGLTDAQFGTWVGASVHDIAQVVGAASTGGATVLSIAVVVKLTRIALLAPIVAGVSFQQVRTTPSVRGGGPPLLPGFVAGFLSMMLLRSTGFVPLEVVEFAQRAEGILFVVAMIGLGSGIRVDRLRGMGLQPLLLGLLAWIVVGSVSLAGALLVA